MDRLLLGILHGLAVGIVVVPAVAAGFIVSIWIGAWVAWAAIQVLPVPPWH